MFQWLFIGLVIWYFYRRFKKRQASEIGRRTSFLRDEEMRDNYKPPSSRPVSEDEYIDYEEVK